MDVSFDLSTSSFPELRDPLSSPEAPPFSPLSSPTPTPENSPTATPLSHQVSPPTPPQDITGPTSTPLPVLPPPVLDTHTGSPPQWHGFKITGDNLDKNLRPRHQTIQKQTQSLHYFNCYASLDRVDLSSFGNDPPMVDIQSLNMETILPNAEDREQLLSNFAVIACRVLVKYVPALANLPGLTTDHIKHQRYKEMSKCSKVVCQLIIIINM